MRHDGEHMRCMLLQHASADAMCAQCVLAAQSFTYELVWLGSRRRQNVPFIAENEDIDVRVIGR